MFWVLNCTLVDWTALFKITTLVYDGEKFYWECIGAYIDWDKQFMTGIAS